MASSSESKILLSDPVAQRNDRNEGQVGQQTQAQQTIISADILLISQGQLLCSRSRALLQCQIRHFLSAGHRGPFLLASSQQGQLDHQR